MVGNRGSKELQVTGGIYVHYWSKPRPNLGKIMFSRIMCASDRWIGFKGWVVVTLERSTICTGYVRCVSRH